MVDVTKNLGKLDTPQQKFDACIKLVRKRNDISDMLATSQMLRDNCLKNNSWSVFDDEEYTRQFLYWHDRLDEIENAVSKYCDMKVVEKAIDEMESSYEKY